MLERKDSGHTNNTGREELESSSRSIALKQARSGKCRSFPPERRLSKQQQRRISTDRQRETRGSKAVCKHRTSKHYATRRKSRSICSFVSAARCRVSRIATRPSAKLANLDVSTFIGERVHLAEY